MRPHALDAWSEKFRERWSPSVNSGVTRIGVHAGPALVGNFGGSRFSITPPMATPSYHRKARDRQQASGHAHVRQRRVADAAEGFKGRPVGDLNAALGAASRFALTNPGPENSRACGEQFSMPSPNWKPKRRRRCRFPRAGRAACPTTRWRFHLRRLLNGAKGVRMQLE